MAALNLLDTPKRLSLTTRSADLRTALKEWEKSYAAAHGGQKPGKDDIKADHDISRKYKEYNQLRDVLAGKLAVDALDGQQSPRRRARTKRPRADSAVSLTPQKHRHPHGAHPNDLDPYDHPASASPKTVFLDSIGPTPQRDGKVLGLFDLLSRSGRSSYATPSAKKRKINTLYNEAGRETPIAQTPRQRKEAGDLLDHLTGDVFDSASKRKHSRTPASEGRKFMLNHFFATPTAMRYAAITDHSPDAETLVDKTPLRSMVLGLSPSNLAPADATTVDATPAYLKRSFSFKDRLLSASSSSATQPRDDHTNGFTSPTIVRTRPRALHRTKSMPKPLSQIVQDLRKLEDEQHDDDMDALHEIEGNTNTRLPPKSDQNTSFGVDDGAHSTENTHEAGQKLEPRVWKKRGQKRTTRRSVMRPGYVKPGATPTWVAPEEEDGDGNEDEVTRVEEIQLVEAELTSSIYGDFSDDELALLDELPQLQSRKRQSPQKALEDEEFDVNGEDGPESPKAKPRKSSKSQPNDKAKKSRKGKEKEKKGTETERTINPNAHSHMNFRSLKIRNKNSKAKGGGRFGGKFGKARR